MLARFAREADMDVFLLAGRYTLLDQEALPELLPLCVERGIAIVLGGVMNSGVLADPRADSHFNYEPAPAARSWSGRARLEAVCARHGVPLRAAAIQFPLAHPAVASLVAGVRKVGHLDDYPALMRLPIDPDLWTETSEPKGSSRRTPRRPAEPDQACGRLRRNGSDSAPASQRRSSMRSGTRSSLARARRRVMLAAYGPSAGGPGRRCRSTRRPRRSPRRRSRSRVRGPWPGPPARRQRQVRDGA